MDRLAWRKANPAIGKFRSQSDIEDFAVQAERLPAKANSFRWLYLNQRIEAQSPFLSRSEWELNSALPNVEPGDTCFAGLDLSSSRDLTALVLVFPKDDKFHVVPYLWLPEDGLRDKAREAKIPWDLWAEQGHLLTIPGPVIIPEVIARTVAEIADTYDLVHLAYDRWRINDFQRELDNIGAAIPMKSFGQGFKDMAPAVDKVEQLVAERRLLHGNHPVLNMCAAGAVVQSDPAGNRKLNKAKSYSKIDGLVALAMALGAMASEENQPSVSPWDDPDYKLSA
jgi:phage terminase large subunit-like protein